MQITLFNGHFDLRTPNHPDLSHLCGTVYVDQNKLNIYENFMDSLGYPSFPFSLHSTSNGSYRVHVIDSYEVMSIVLANGHLTFRTHESKRLQPKFVVRVNIAFLWHFRFEAYLCEFLLVQVADTGVLLVVVDQISVSVAIEDESMVA